MTWHCAWLILCALVTGASCGYAYVTRQWRKDIDRRNDMMRRY